MCKNSSTFDLLLKGDFPAKANMHLNRPFAKEKALPVAFKIQAKCPRCLGITQQSFQAQCCLYPTFPRAQCNLQGVLCCQPLHCPGRGRGTRGADVLCVVICAMCLRCCLSCCLRPGAETLARRLRRGYPLLEQRAA